MGSSGRKRYLLEAITALTSGEAQAWNAVILAPAAVCPLAQALERAEGHKNIYITDAFVPAPKVNALADVVVCHGGQGTVQTAMASGTPIAGIAMQMEQQLHLDHIAEAGAGIRLPITRWTAKNIQHAIQEVIELSSYQEHARKLQQRYLGIDGKKSVAREIWHFITRQLHKKAA